MQSKDKRRASPWIVGLLALAGMALAAGETLAVDTPFTITNESDSKAYSFGCNGPILRSSSTIDVDSGQSTQWYTATHGFVDQFGQWNCGAYFETPDLDIDGHVPPAPTQIDFCFSDVSSNRNINLVYSGSGRNTMLSVEFWPTSCSSSTQSSSTFLGDNSLSQLAQNALRSHGVSGDVDHYIIDGTAGDLLHIRVERDGARGSQGSQLKIELSQVVAGARQVVPHSGGVPLEFEQVLQFSGPYSIAIEQPDAKVEDPFHGYYILRVTSDFGEDLTLRPHTTAEP